jgi:hypothetical protein
VLEWRRPTASGVVCVALEPPGRRVGLRRARAVVATLALVLALAATLGAGIWIGSGGQLFPQKTPRVIYVTPTDQPNGTTLPADASAVTLYPGTSATPGVTPEATPGQSVESTDTLPPPATATAPTPTSKATATPKPPTPKPPTPVPTDSPKPDLTVYTFELGRIVPSCNLDFTVRLSVKNQGAGAMPHAVVASIVDSSAGSLNNAKVMLGVPALQQNAIFSQDVTMLVNADCGQQHELTVRLDEAGTIGETSQMNNVASFVYYLGIEPMN